MALPLVLAGVAASVLGVASANELHKRYQTYSNVVIAPGDSSHRVSAQHGSIVCCGIYNGLIHTGIWTDEGIVEKAGSGLIRCISPQRFIKDRSGNSIFVLGDLAGQTLINKCAGDKALSEVFTYTNYHLTENNCHRYVANAFALSDANKTVLFADLNHQLSEHFAAPLAYYRLAN